MKCEAGDAVDVVGAVVEVANVPDQLAFVIKKDPPSNLEEVLEVVIEGPRQVERGAVDRVREIEIERVALRCGSNRW